MRMDYDKEPSMRVMRDMCEARKAGCWNLLNYAGKAYRKGELSLRDFKFIKNKLNKAMHQFDRIIELIDAPHSCEDCARASSMLSDEEWDCTIADKLSEQDIDLCKEGHCPRWVRREDAETEEEETDE